MSDLVRSLVSENGFVLLVLVLGLWIAARPASRIARRGLVITAIVYACASIYGISYLLEQLLSAGYRPFAAADVPPGRTAIVVLGSDSFTARDWDRGEYSIVDHASAERAREAIRVFHLIDAEWMIASGGRIDSRSPNVPTGIATREALIALGVPVSRVQALPGPGNTSEEAAAVVRLIRRIGAEHVVVVTSRLHMRRSVGTFRAAGIEVIPAAARNSFLDQHWPEWWLPSHAGIDEAEGVAHEYLGIVGYIAQRRYKF